MLEVNLCWCERSRDEFVMRWAFIDLCWYQFMRSFVDINIRWDELFRSCIDKLCLSEPVVGMSDVEASLWWAVLTWPWLCWDELLLSCVEMSLWWAVLKWAYGELCWDDRNNVEISLCWDERVYVEVSVSWDVVRYAVLRWTVLRLTFIEVNLWRQACVEMSLWWTVLRWP